MIFNFAEVLFNMSGFQPARLDIDPSIMDNKEGIIM